ncbi:MAG TPA: helix-turn-helix domain-containing protein [Verrucomicrobiae bacterium]|jgi:cytoskeletal protein RodZ
MPTVAEQLRIGREAKNLTVEQVADVTKIRTDYVRALEEGNFGAFSAPIYIRGSVKSYAMFLRLDVPVVLATLEAELKGTQEFSEPPPLTEQKTTMLDTLTLYLARVNWKMGFVGILALLGVIICVVIFLSLRHHTKNNPVTNLKPAVYQPAHTSDTLPLPRH